MKQNDRCRWHRGFEKIPEAPHLDAVKRYLEKGVRNGVLSERKLRVFVKRELKGIVAARPRFTLRSKVSRDSRRSSIGFRTERGNWLELVLPRFEGLRIVGEPELYRKSGAQVEEQEMERPLWSIAMLLQAEIGIT